MNQINYLYIMYVYISISAAFIGSMLQINWAVPTECWVYPIKLLLCMFKGSLCLSICTSTLAFKSKRHKDNISVHVSIPESSGR